MIKAYLVFLKTHYSDNDMFCHVFSSDILAKEYIEKMEREYKYKDENKDFYIVETFYK